VLHRIAVLLVEEEGSHFFGGCSDADVLDAFDFNHALIWKKVDIYRRNIHV